MTGIKMVAPNRFLLPLLVAGIVASCSHNQSPDMQQANDTIGRIAISTVPFPEPYRVRSATYTPSGKLLVSYAGQSGEDPDFINLAVMDDDGSNFDSFFSQRVPERPKANGIRYMVFADNRRIFLGDYILECAPDLDNCEASELVPVDYPEQIADGDSIMARWSEMIIAPDNRHVAWTTLLSNLYALVFTGELERDAASYRIVKPRIISTLEPFREDENNPGRFIPNIIRGGEVKQFVHGGTAISLVGMKDRNTPDSIVQDLLSNDMEQITYSTAYTETTILSPDEKLGITMSTCFSEISNLAILGLMPRPYPASMDMGLSMLHYSYAVTGVRKSRPGNVGPMLIDIEQSENQKDCQGINLNTSDEWVYYSPMSWHPGGKKALWKEGRRGTKELRIQMVTLLDYEPQQAVAAQETPETIPYALSDMSVLEDVIRQRIDLDVRVDGNHSGYIAYRRLSDGALSTLIEKRYVNFSDDGKNFYNGVEKMQKLPASNSVYTSNVEVTGQEAGRMELKITFGPIRDKLPAKILFDVDESGSAQTTGFSEYIGKRLSVESLIP